MLARQRVLASRCSLPRRPPSTCVASTHPPAAAHTLSNLCLRCSARLAAMPFVAVEILGTQMQAALLTHTHTAWRPVPGLHRHSAPWTRTARTSTLFLRRENVHFAREPGIAATQAALAKRAHR